MKIERGEDPGLVCVKGYSGIVLRVREFQPDLSADMSTDLYRTIHACRWNQTRNSELAAVCEVIIGKPPSHWETCTPYGHYRVSVKNLRRLSTLEALALVSVDE